MPFWAARGAALGVVLARRYVRTAAALIHRVPGLPAGYRLLNCVRQVCDADACSRHEIRQICVLPDRQASAGHNWRCPRLLPHAFRSHV
jgi:hypothetical protein